MQVTEKVVPKIFFSNTSYEYWGRVAALIHVSADGKKDAAYFGQCPDLSPDWLTAFFGSVSAGRSAKAT